MGARHGARIESGAALVTGAGRGLGFEIAARLGSRGLRVHVTDIDADAATEAARRIGAGAWGSALDVADSEACLAAARRTEADAGPLRVWVNNAGILSTGYAWSHAADQRRQMFEVNALGTINGTIAALEVMRPRDEGHIINVVSLAGIVAAPGETLYSATKHAAMAFTLGTLLDLRRAGVKRVQLSAVCPDGIWTPMLFDKVDDPEAAASWSGVLLTPQRVADAAVGLLDRPRPILVIPRWRGWLIRLMDANPALFVRLLPLLLADARRKQRKFRRSLS